jgi:hypothetical protein
VNEPELASPDPALLVVPIDPLAVAPVTTIVVPTAAVAKPEPLPLLKELLADAPGDPGSAGSGADPLPESLVETMPPHALTARANVNPTRLELIGASLS